MQAKKNKPGKPENIIALYVTALPYHLFSATLLEGHGVAYSHALNKMQRVSRVPGIRIRSDNLFV